MIPFEEIDAALKSLGKDRAWLAAESGRSPNSIRAALAPNGNEKQKSALIQKALSDAIEREEARQANAALTPFAEPPEIPAGHTAIYLTGQLYEDAERASRIVGAPTLAAFCHDVIQTQARLIIADAAGKSNGTTGQSS
jgi:hypothetical protein